MNIQCATPHNLVHTRCLLLLLLLFNTDVLYNYNNSNNNSHSIRPLQMWNLSLQYISVQSICHNTGNNFTIARK
jgi:hypothetical protein